MLAKALQGGTSAAKTYVDDVFSTYLYTGNGSTQTITNGIDLAGKGGLVWIKGRAGPNVNPSDHCLTDTVRGTSKQLATNATAAETTNTSRVTAFNSNGFAVGGSALTNASSSDTYASWTFRKAPKFFDVVTYTGTGSGTSQNIAHSLGVAPGMVVVKQTNGAQSWYVYHRSIGPNFTVYLDQTLAQDGPTSVWNSTNPTSAVFTVSTGINQTGATYVAYLFAHDTAADGLIQCGSFTTDGSGNATVNLGWEPQFSIIKASSGTSSWAIRDTMRGWVADTSGTTSTLFANVSNAENTGTGYSPTATGINISGAGASTTFIYIAIRRPNKPPTSGTQVYTGVTQAASTEYSVGFPADLVMAARRGGNAINTSFGDRLRGKTLYLVSSSTAAEATNSPYIFDFNTSQNGIIPGFSSSSSIYWNFRRAPGFFDQVCYTGTGSATTVAHNLGVAPELMIVKSRSGTSNWYVYSATTGAGARLGLNQTIASTADTTVWNNTAPTASVFSVPGGANDPNISSTTYVAYLFASLPGISKVGSYTGNGSSQTINCGFTGGARFVLIKRTDSTGDWYVWDTARGIVSGNDPHLSLNSTAAEVTTNDSIDPDNSGFVVNQLAATNINVNSATYIYLAIA